MSSTQPYKYFLIKLLQIQITTTTTPQPPNPIYFSFSLHQTLYFSSSITPKTQTLSDDIIMQIQNKNIDNIQLQRWQNHMIMYTYDIDLVQLKTRNTLMKQIQTKAGQILKFLIIGVKQQQIQFGSKFIQNITQHYLVIESIQLVNQDINNNRNKRQGEDASYLKIVTENNCYILPIMQSCVLIKLPEKFQFFMVKNGREVGRSEKYKPQQLKQQVQLDPINGSKNSFNIKLSLKWGINFLQAKPQNTLLLGSQQIMIYQIQLKFQSSSQYGNSKIKFVISNKAFDLGNQFSSTKSSKIKKIIYLIAKSQDQQIIIVIQKNVKIIAQAKFQVEQIIPFTVHLIKKKIFDTNGKLLGSIKFKCQKAKNLSNPTNDKFWRQSGRTKTTNNLLLIFDQISVKYQSQIPILLSLKTQAQQKFLKNVPNFTYFNKNLHVSISPIVLSLKQDQSIYIILKDMTTQQQNQSDFIGIALYNCSSIRLGMNTIQIKLFKNQTHTITLNCICHKIVSYPFIKPTFQPQLLQILSHRSIFLSVVMREIYFSPYFYTYTYDNKNQVYCIVQINKQKKVLIIQNKNKNNQLSFNISSSSDNLDFNIQQTQILKIKITFLVSDIGQEQEIYGYCIIKAKVSQLQSTTGSLKFYLIEIKNDFGSNLGQVNLQIHKSSLFNSHQKQSRDILQSGNNKAKILQGQKRRLKMHLAQISQSVQLKQKQKQKTTTQQNKNQLKLLMGKKNFQLPQTKKSVSRYQKIPTNLVGQRRQRNNSVIGIQGTLKLPPIREQSASPQGKKSYNQLIQMMKIRKRSVKGSYQQNSMLQSYQMRDYHKKSNAPYKFDDPPIQTLHLKQKIQKQNPNLNRNMQILFPKKSARLQKNSSVKRPISQEQKKLIGLKSVFNQITSDMGQIQPTVKDQQFYRNQQKNSQKIQYSYQNNDNKQQINHLKGPQWDDNQFLV